MGQMPRWMGVAGMPGGYWVVDCVRAARGSQSGWVSASCACRLRTRRGRQRRRSHPVDKCGLNRARRVLSARTAPRASASKLEPHPRDAGWPCACGRWKWRQPEQVPWMRAQRRQPRAQQQPLRVLRRGAVAPAASARLRAAGPPGCCRAPGPETGWWTQPGAAAPARQASGRPAEAARPRRAGRPQTARGTQGGTWRVSQRGVPGRAVAWLHGTAPRACHPPPGVGPTPPRPCPSPHLRAHGLLHVAERLQAGPHAHAHAALRRTGGGRGGQGPQPAGRHAQLLAKLAGCRWRQLRERLLHEQLVQAGLRVGVGRGTGGEG